MRPEGSTLRFHPFPHSILSQFSLLYILHCFPSSIPSDAVQVYFPCPRTLDLHAISGNVQALRRQSQERIPPPAHEAIHSSGHSGSQPALDAVTRVGTDAVGLPKAFVLAQVLGYELITAELYEPLWARLISEGQRLKVPAFVVYG